MRPTAPAERTQLLGVLVCGDRGPTAEPYDQLVERRIAEPLELLERVLVHIDQRAETCDLVQRDPPWTALYPEGAVA